MDVRGRPGERQVDVALRDPTLAPAAIADAMGLRASRSEVTLELLVRPLGVTDGVFVLHDLARSCRGSSDARLGSLAAITRGERRLQAVRHLPSLALRPRLHVGVREPTGGGRPGGQDEDRSDEHGGTGPA